MSPLLINTDLLLPDATVKRPKIGSSESSGLYKFPIKADGSGALKPLLLSTISLNVL
jgi:hypothetical protein